MERADSENGTDDMRNNERRGAFLDIFDAVLD